MVEKIIVNTKHSSFLSKASAMLKFFKDNDALGQLHKTFSNIADDLYKKC